MTEANYLVVKIKGILNDIPMPTDDNSDNEDNGQIGTFRSGPEYVIEELGSKLNNGNSTSFIGKTFSKILDLFADKINLIVPGTHWCGDGNVATNESDLGLFNNSDYCCKNHDECSNNLEAGQSQGPLINNGIFTRSSCTCDHEFYKCLKNAGTLVASGIGNTYFTILRPQCFQEDYPIESCANYDHVRLFRKKCLEYNYDKSKEKKLQWFDNPDF
ncbi:hypothetical protein PV328_011395 [Microctonus aethiopoides]|uniref:Phospholipase A2 n=1 Tax=Microctonus aethiopoides TaxID=144406 RepID=A0AA39C4C9_9HYME|nr:hypothetical protein PV328_011395 [Microctonus aethiopoides]